MTLNRFFFFLFGKDDCHNGHIPELVDDADGLHLFQFEHVCVLPYSAVLVWRKSQLCY